MPYIIRERREVLQPIVDQLAPRGPGELNYIITRIIHNYIINATEVAHYADLAEGVAALECAKLELYRIVVARYEDLARQKNGPVSTLEDRWPQ